MTGPAPRRARVRLGERETDIRIGVGLYPALWSAVTAAFPLARRVGVAIDERVRGLWPPPAPPSRLEVQTFLLPAGEAAKDRDVLASLQDCWIELRRDEPVVVIGGGAALDVGGFAAATVRRGIPWVAVPTSVVGMADASVGGKTAVNHPRGKNLLGTFHAPQLVLADVDLLATLASRDTAAGLAEIYKSGRVGDVGLLDVLRAGVPRDAAGWVEVIHRAVTVKARLVEADERDVGARRLLNYGHTIGHALETLLGNAALRHGEAVAIGMDIAAAIAEARNLLPAVERDRQVRDLSALQLDCAWPAGVSVDAVLAQIALDKKRVSGAQHTLVLPHGACGAEVHDDVTDAEIKAALHAAAEGRERRDS